eukprot:5098599-Amphidinium_carterae.1
MASCWSSVRVALQCCLAPYTRELRCYEWLVRLKVYRALAAVSASDEAGSTMRLEGLRHLSSQGSSFLAHDPRAS